MQTRPEKLSKEDLEQIAGLDSAKLDMLAAWANKKLTCSHGKRCTLRCEVLKEPALDMGLVEEGYRAVVALPFGDQPDAVLQVVHGEKSRLPFDSLLVAPPCVDEVAVRRQVAPVAQGACHHHGESLVLVDIAVGVAPVDALQQVLALRKHGIDSLS